MANFAKVAIIGEASGQEVVNILYYAPNAVAPAQPLDPTERNILASSVIAEVVPSLLTVLHSSYTLRELQVTAVDENNETTSDYAVVQPATGAGGHGGGADSAGIAAIVGFQCSYPFTGAPVGVRVPKKSYLAIGPMASESVGDDGAVLLSALEQEALIANLALYLDGDANNWIPVRVGVNGPNGPAVGKVDGAVVRPYVRPRKSRLKRANAR